MAKTFINGNKIQMGFALSAYVDEAKKNAEDDCDDDRIGCFNVLRPAIRFRKLNNIVERNYNDYGKDANGCDDFECEVEEGEEVGIYVNGDYVYGPIKGGSVITIV